MGHASASDMRVVKDSVIKQSTIMRVEGGNQYDSGFGDRDDGPWDWSKGGLERV